MTDRVYNFSAGPAVLPVPVLEEAQKNLLSLPGVGMSVLESSHRSPHFTEIIETAEANLRNLLNVPDNYSLLFLQGGASLQFSMIAINFLSGTEKPADYILTGSWGKKAIKEAKNFGKVEVVASSKEQNYTFIPKGYKVPANAKYLHLTSNNTIVGTQYHSWPETKVPFVADMSSDIFSRPIDVERFDLIYAGAQKNIGPAGLTLVIVRKEALGKVSRNIPTMLDYRTHISKKSTFNTPPVFPIYVAMLTFRWIKANGGLQAMAQKNAAKAQLLYQEVDANPFFTGTVTEKADRSHMNATFVMAPGKEELQASFLDMCKEAGCVGVKGHRSVGGFRASIYNAMDIESVQVLVDVMKAFAEQYG